MSSLWNTDLLLFSVSLRGKSGYKFPILFHLAACYWCSCMTHCLSVVVGTDKNFLERNLFLSFFLINIFFIRSLKHSLHVQDPAEHLLLQMSRLRWVLLQLLWFPKPSPFLVSKGNLSGVVKHCTCISSGEEGFV